MPVSMVSFRRALYALMVLACLAILVFAYMGLRNFGRPVYTVNTSGNTIVKELQNLNRLETAQFHVEKVIQAGTNGNVFQEFLYGDRILLIAVGSVVAGIDLSKMKEGDIKLGSGNASGTIEATFPAPEIFSASLDNDQTRVFDRKLGLLTKGDVTLESRARATAEDIMREGACKEGVLDTARTNAMGQLESFLKALGFDRVTVTIPQSSC
jgi:Protein of unknown function (DUF4230)